MRILHALLSEWTFVAIGAVMLVCVAMAVHDDRPPTLQEHRLAYGSLALVGAWLLGSAPSWFVIDARGRGAIC